jgi:hypothetical protein
MCTEYLSLKGNSQDGHTTHGGDLLRPDAATLRLRLQCRCTRRHARKERSSELHTYGVSHQVRTQHVTGMVTMPSTAANARALRPGSTCPSTSAAPGYAQTIKSSVQYIHAGGHDTSPYLSLKLVRLFSRCLHLLRHGGAEVPRQGARHIVPCRRHCQSTLAVPTVQSHCITKLTGHRAPAPAQGYSTHIGTAHQQP